MAGDSRGRHGPSPGRSEEHTSELQSRFELVCRLLFEKKKKPPPLPAVPSPPPRSRHYRLPAPRSAPDWRPRRGSALLPPPDGPPHPPDRSPPPLATRD